MVFSGVQPVKIGQSGSVFGGGSIIDDEFDFFVRVISVVQVAQIAFEDSAFDGV